MSGNEPIDPDLNEEVEPSFPDPAEIADKAKQDLSASHAELEDRLKQIEASAAKGQRHYKQAMPKPEAGEGSSLDADSAKGLGLGLTVAYAILGVPIVGFGIGFLIDMQTGGSLLWRSVFGLLGFVGGVTYAVMMTNKNNK